jgi:phosphohistidine swiveling domain-containing protein
MEEPEPAEAPLTLVCVTVHAKVAPPVLLVIAIEEALPEQIEEEAGVAVAEGAGFTVTVAVIAEPLQVPTEGVIV